MSSELATVLDLGSTKIACLAACYGKSGALDIRAAATAECKGVRRGVVADLDETSAAITVAIQRAEQQLGEDIGSLVVGIAGSHLEGVNAQGFVPIYPRSRTITREDVLQVINHSRQVVLPPDREQIEAIPREFRIDGQRGIQRPIGMSGGRLEVVTYLVTGQTTHLQNVEKAVSMAGRQVEQMVLQPLASGLGVLTAEELDLGVVVADVGGGTTDVAVFSGGSIAFSASLPIGGQLVTSDLSKLLKTSPDEAERLKTEAGCALARLVGEKESVTVTQLGQAEARPLQRRVLCEIIESRMREIAKMVWQQIERSGLNGMLPGGIVLTGGGSRLSGSADLFGDVLKNMRVRVGEPDVDGKAHGGYSFATAVGLARYALDSFEDELVPASGVTDWKQKIRTLWSVIRT